MPDVPFVVDVLPHGGPCPLPPAASAIDAPQAPLGWQAELLGAVAGSPSAAQGAQLAADTLCRRLEVKTVVLGLCDRRGRRCRVTAVSGCSGFDHRTELAQAMQAVIDETMLRSRSASPAGSRGVATSDEKRLLAAAGASHLHAAVLRDAQHAPRGVWLLLDKRTFTEGRPWREACQAAPQLAACLGLLVRAEPGHAARLARRVSRRWRSWRVVAGGLLLLAVGALLAVPYPYRVRCECRIQPVVRRFVAAPFEAKLDEAFAEPGDVVRQGQPLARLNDREIRWELAGLEADYNRAQKMRDGSLAGQEVASAQIAGLEMERLGLRIRLLKDRIEKLDIKSPIAGLLISGDLKKTEGAPLTRGQTLFEIAPLERMLVEVLIPDREIASVDVGAPVDVRLEAFPQLAFRGTLGKLHPRAEQTEGRNVFLGEVLLDNPEQVLRPGMCGRASIRGPVRPLGWNLFHRAYETACAGLGW
jgi:hypothetical protein